MSRRQARGADAMTNPARPRLLTRARRGAFVVLLAALVASAVTSAVVAVVVGDGVLDDDADRRLDRAVDRAEQLPPVALGAITGPGRVEVRDGQAVGARDAPAGLDAIVADAAASGTVVERTIDIADRSSRVRAVPVGTGDGDGTVVLGIITSHESATASFVARLLVTHAALFVAFAGIALVVSRRSTRIMESLFQQEDQLMRAVVHEVRNPLSRALVAVDEGLAGVADPKTALDEAATFVEDADELIGDLLETARVMTGAARLATDVVALHEVAEDAARTASTEECTVVLDMTPVEVVGSARLLRRAVSNLVRNAVRHAYAGGPGVITVRVDTGGVTVLDDGPGVPEERLAELHYDTSLTTVDQKGPGLGLNICGWVAEMHGGRLHLANRPDGGLAAALEVEARPAPPGNLAPRTIGKVPSGTVHG